MSTQIKTVTDSDVSHKMAQRSPKKKVHEKDIQREICDWLSTMPVFFWRSNNVPVFQQDRYGARFRKLPKYTPKGLPDILILHKGLFIGLEVKVPDYWKITDDQIKMKDNFINNGGSYYVVTSLQEAKDKLEFYL